jgi:hypothetical protein
MFPPLVPSPCVLVQWASTAADSTINGVPALTTDSVGLCIAATQAPQGPVIVIPTQTLAAGL